MEITDLAKDPFVIQVAVLFFANRFRRLLAKQKIIEFPTKLEIFAVGALRTIFYLIRGKNFLNHIQNDAVQASCFIYEFFLYFSYFSYG